jgi:hypothetical protein
VYPGRAGAVASGLDEEAGGNGVDGLYKMLTNEKAACYEIGATTNPAVGQWIVTDFSFLTSTPFSLEGASPTRSRCRPV